MKTILKKFLALSLKARVAAATIVVVGVTGGTTVAVVHHNKVIAHRNQVKYEASKDINKSSQNTANADTSTSDTNDQTAPSTTPASTTSSTDSQASTAVTSNASSNSGSSSSGSSSKASSNNNSSSKSSTKNNASSGPSSSKTSSNSNSSSKSSTSSNSSSNKIVNDTITNPSNGASNWIYDETATHDLQRNWHETTYSGSKLNTMNMSLNLLTRGYLSESSVKQLYLGKIIDSKYKITNVYATCVTTPKENIDAIGFYNSVKNAGLFNQTFSGIKFDDVKTVINLGSDKNNVRNYRLVIQMESI